MREEEIPFSRITNHASAFCIHHSAFSPLPMSTILGIESTCDETGAAVVGQGYRVRSNVVATQVEIHAKYRGVVPEIASRAHIENILPVLREALARASVRLDQLDAVAVAHRPGLIGSLLIGVTAAKTLAWSIGRPLIGVDHVHAHLYSVRLHEEAAPRPDNNAARDAPSPRPVSSLPAGPSADEPVFPAVGMVVSGGHTALYRMGGWEDVELIGTTIDDAVGEAYDKVAAVLGLPYPGGPAIDQLAQRGTPRSVQFPRSMLGRDSLDFSFSGLKTAVLYHVRGHQGRQRDARALSSEEIADVAAAFQSACIDVLLRKLQRAIAHTAARSVIVGGGVSANTGLRQALAHLGLPVHLPAQPFCTDNAAMSAGLAEVYYQQQRFSPLDLDAITHSQFKP
jgi:N6-L-threonylcarbamoyladenine synthase